MVYYKPINSIETESLNMGISPPWRLVVLGDGEDKEKLKTLIFKENIEGVTLAGFHQVEEIPAYYALSNLFIHSALQDQWGVVVNEAMACGLPVLVSRQSGCAGELVQEGVNGFVFDASDIMSLSTLMFQFSSGNYDLGAFGRSSQEIIKNWGTERFAEGIYSAIMCCLEKGL